MPAVTHSSEQLVRRCHMIILQAVVDPLILTHFEAAGDCCEKELSGTLPRTSHISFDKGSSEGATTYRNAP